MLVEFGALILNSEDDNCVKNTENSQLQWSRIPLCKFVNADKFQNKNIIMRLVSCKLNQVDDFDYENAETTTVILKGPQFVNGEIYNSNITNNQATMCVLDTYNLDTQPLVVQFQPSFQWKIRYDSYMDFEINLIPNLDNLVFSTNYETSSFLFKFYYEQ